MRISSMTELCSSQSYETLPSLPRLFPIRVFPSSILPSSGLPPSLRSLGPPLGISPEAF